MIDSRNLERIVADKFGFQYKVNWSRRNFSDSHGQFDSTISSSQGIMKVNTSVSFLDPASRFDQAMGLLLWLSREKKWQTVIAFSSESGYIHIDGPGEIRMKRTLGKEPKQMAYDICQAVLAVAVMEEDLSDKDYS